MITEIKNIELPAGRYKINGEFVDVGHSFKVFTVLSKPQPTDSERADVREMARVYEKEREKYLGGTSDYYPNNQAAFEGCMDKAIRTSIQSNAQGVDKWQPIETAPKDGKEVRLARIGCEVECERVGYYLNGKFWICGEKEFVQPTHWKPVEIGNTCMDLPSPPTGESQKG